MLQTMTFNFERTNQLATSPFMVTTDIAEWLGLKGFLSEKPMLYRWPCSGSISKWYRIVRLVAHMNFREEPKKTIENEAIANIKRTHGSGSMKQLQEQMMAFEQSILTKKSFMSYTIR
ncbi:MAG: hypothetical protein Ct9H90mP11_02690 [Acidimicrobiales bacterium]|nr:MAG: hypothetical protein Ct9H90mP11_02690 [Acidimicrobiales bacterium]